MEKIEGDKEEFKVEAWCVLDWMVEIEDDREQFTIEVGVINNGKKKLESPPKKIFRDCPQIDLFYW